MALVRLDKIKNYGHILSVIPNEDCTNGSVMAVGTLASDGEAFNVAKPAAVATDLLVLIASVPLQYNEPAFEDTFVNKANKKARGYLLEKGDMITVTDDLLTVVPVVGDIVEPVNSAFKLTKQATPAATLSFKCVETTTLYGNSAKTLLVVKA